MGLPPSGATVGFFRLPEGVLTEFVGSVQPGSPLRELFDSFGAEAATILEEELVGGIALGRNPSQIARLIRGRLNVGLGRARIIARTEVLRSYRSSTLAAYRRNPTLVQKWVWHASLGTRCCPACWALHGSEHELDEEPSMHIACRCSLVPRTATWKELGFDVPDSVETSAQIPSGPNVFAALPPADQLAILGPKKFALYASGAVELRDFVRVRRSRQWGTTRSVASAEDALERAAQRGGLPPPVSGGVHPPFRYDPAAFSTYRERQFADWRANATPEEVDALIEYKNYSSPVNKYLREGVVTGGLTEVRIQESIRHIDNALAKATLDQDVYLYRGIRTPQGLPPHLANAQANDTITDLGYVSASTTRQFAERDFSADQPDSMVWEVVVHRGAHGLFIDPLTRPALLEDEILLERGLDFFVREVRRDPGGRIRLLMEVL